MTGFSHWLEGLVCYFILLFAVMNFLPDSSYKKYIQFYMGLLLILTVFSPLLEFSGVEGTIRASIESFQAEEEQWEKKAEAWEKDWQEKTGIIEGVEVAP